MQLAKSEHMDRLDSFCSSRERLVMLTSLWQSDIVLEPNMFPCKCHFNILPCKYDRYHLLTRFFYLHLPYHSVWTDSTPVGIEHYTLWSVQDLSHDEVRLP